MLQIYSNLSFYLTKYSRFHHNADLQQTNVLIFHFRSLTFAIVCNHST